MSYGSKKGETVETQPLLIGYESTSSLAKPALSTSSIAGIMTKTLIKFSEDILHCGLCIRRKYIKTGILLLSIILLLVFITPNSFADNYDRSYSSQLQFGIINRKLYVSVPSSLYDYYSGRTIKLANDNEYSKLVTPDAVKPIAESLQNITRNNPRSDEAFANAVLTLVHQIPYADGDVTYPVETLVENSGKCDTLSLLAASIMKAGGLDVVLLYHKEVHHINVGVYLPYEPHTTWWWLQPTGYEFEGKKYWIAECTPAMEWKVGDVPPLLADTQPWIIPLENSEESSPAHVSSKLGSPANSSSISINLSSDPSAASYQGHMLTISGSISPAYPNETVVVYFSQNGIFYNALRTETDNWGNYSFSWNLTSTGTYYVRTSWSGNADCAGADSETFTVFLGFPQSLIQFQGLGYYYTYGSAYIAAHELRVRQGFEDFLNMNLTGTGVLLTGEFIILRDEQNTSSMQTKTIIIPASEKTIYLGRGQRRTITIPARTATIPVIPEGLYQRRLPDDFDLKMNNKFGFILRNDIGGNYSVSVRGMDDSDIAQISQPNGNRTVFMNSSTNIGENSWYRIEARMDEDETSATLCDVNGTLLESRVIPHGEIAVSELVILIANNTDSTVAFKNLRIETLDEPTQLLPEDNEKKVNAYDLLAPHVAFSLLLATTFAVVIYKKRSRVKSPLRTLKALGNFRNMHSAEISPLYKG